MTILDYYIRQQSIKVWYDKFYSSSNKQSGKTFNYFNTNYRHLLSFLHQFNEFRSKVGVDRKDWKDKLPGGQELDKHRVTNLTQAGFLKSEDSFFYVTAKGMALCDLIDSKLSDRCKWFLLYLLLLDYYSSYRQLDIIYSTKDYFAKLNAAGYSNDLIIDYLKKAMRITDKKSLFKLDIFWLITFANDEVFINLFSQSSELDKNDLKDYVINCTKNSKSTDLIAHKYVNSGVYSAISFSDDLKVLYYTNYALSCFTNKFDDFISLMVDAYCEQFCSEKDKKDILDFINNHKSIYVKVKQNLIKGVE